MIAASDQVGDIRLGALRIKGAFLVDELLHQLPIRNHSRGAGPEFERVDPAIPLRPRRELEMGAFLRDLVDVA